MANKSSALIFGASGAIGSACLEVLKTEFFTFQGSRSKENLQEGGPFDAVVWAQGLNQTKQFVQSTEEDWELMMEANFHFVRRSVLSLIEDNKVENPASFVFIGSVWSIFSKIDKSAYIVSKSALEGLARSLSVELAPANIRVNCVLPGVIDNSMTRSNLTELQLKRIQHETPGQKLITAVQVANIVKFLCSENSQGINGQSIIVDSGWSIARYI